MAKSKGRFRTRLKGPDKQVLQLLSIQVSLRAHKQETAVAGWLLRKNCFPLLAPDSSNLSATSASPAESAPFSAGPASVSPDLATPASSVYQFSSTFEHTVESRVKTRDNTFVLHIWRSFAKLYRWQKKTQHTTASWTSCRNCHATHPSTVSWCRCKLTAVFVLLNSEHTCWSGVYWSHQLSLKSFFTDTVASWDPYRSLPQGGCIPLSAVADLRSPKSSLLHGSACSQKRCFADLSLSPPLLSIVGVNPLGNQLPAVLLGSGLTVGFLDTGKKPWLCVSNIWGTMGAGTMILTWRQH